MGCVFSPVSPANQPTYQRPPNPGCIPSCCNARILPDKPSKITGCTFLQNGFLAIVDNSNKRIKLFNKELKCQSFVNLVSRPFDICANRNSLYVTVTKKKLVQKLQISFPMIFITRKLIVRYTFPTEGEGWGIVSYDKDLIIGMKFDTHANTVLTNLSESSWQIQIVSTSGVVKRRIMNNPDGVALVFDAKYLSLTPNKKEIVISENEDNRVKCLDISKGELTFNHHMEDPKGIVVDKNNNIYVLGKHGAIRWILADREYVKVLLSGTRSINYSEAIAYSNTKHALAVPRNENKIEMFRIKNSITAGDI